MGVCSYCGDDSDTSLYTCSYCNRQHCSQHRLPENHKCVGLSGATTLGPEFRGRFNSGEKADQETRGDDYPERITNRDIDTPDEDRLSQAEREQARKEFQEYRNRIETPSTSSPDVNPDGSIKRDNEPTDARDQDSRDYRAAARRAVNAVTTVVALPIVLLKEVWAGLFRRGSLGIPVWGILVIALVVGVFGAAEYGTGVDPIDEGSETAVESVHSSVVGNETSDDDRDSGGFLSPAGPNETEIERQIHQHVNEERDAHGRGEVAFDEDLHEITAYHSERMAIEGFFAHDAPDGETMEDRYHRFGYDCQVSTGGGTYVTGGENIAQSYINERVVGHGYTSDEEDVAAAIVNDWMDSPGHRENILERHWNAHGIGVYVTDDNAVYATQNFC